MSKMMIQNARIAFPEIFKAVTFDGTGEPSYSATLMLGPDHPQLEAIRAAQEAVGIDKWGAKWATVKKEMEAKDKMALHDGNTKDLDGFRGNFFVSTRSKANSRPTVIDRDKTPLVETDGKPYGGCFINASIELWAQDNSYGKRINAQIRGVQFVRDGDSFAGGIPASSDEFEEVSDGAFADDLA
tara:strand:- start:306 stop:860 length:555 start_codon:yes stop_codon:yes gene_type:complete